MLAAILIYLLLNAGIGALVGLLPYFLCKSQGKPSMGQLALLLCTISACLFFGVSICIAIGFSIAAFTAHHDCNAVMNSSSSYNASMVSAAPAYGYSPAVVYPSNHLGIRCLSGPMSGRTYRLDSNGVMIGRSNDCGIRYFGSAPGISRHHACIRWYNGTPALVDMGSSYGSYMADGRQLPPNYPKSLHAGSRFYLGTPNNLFEVVNVA